MPPKCKAQTVLKEATPTKKSSLMKTIYSTPTTEEDEEKTK